MRHASLTLVERFYAALAAFDTAAVVDLADPEMVVTQTTELPWGGRFNGLADLVRFGEGVRRHIDSAVTIDQMFVAGDQVVAVGRTAGTTKAGAAFDVPLVHLFTVRDASIAALQVLIDTEAMKLALAAVPASR